MKSNSPGLAMLKRARRQRNIRLRQSARRHCIVRWKRHALLPFRLFSGLLDWWGSLPLGYSELKVPAEWGKERVRQHIRENFAHRLPQEPRARNIRIAFLIQDHCLWQQATGTVDHRPQIPFVKCKR